MTKAEKQAVLENLQDAKSRLLHSLARCEIDSGVDMENCAMKACEVIEDAERLVQAAPETEAE